MQLIQLIFFKRNAVWQNCPSRLHCMKETEPINACLTEGKCTDSNSHFCFSLCSVTELKNIPVIVNISSTFLFRSFLFSPIVEKPNLNLSEYVKCKSECNFFTMDFASCVSFTVPLRSKPQVSLSSSCWSFNTLIFFCHLLTYTLTVS